MTRYVASCSKLWVAKFESLLKELNKAHISMESLKKILVNESPPSAQESKTEGKRSCTSTGFSKTQTKQNQNIQQMKWTLRFYILISIKWLECLAVTLLLIPIFLFRMCWKFTAWTCAVLIAERNETPSKHSISIPDWHDRELVVNVK